MYDVLGRDHFVKYTNKFEGMSAQALRDALKAKNIPTRGLKKNELISLLRDNLTPGEMVSVWK